MLRRGRGPDNLPAALSLSALQGGAGEVTDSLTHQPTFMEGPHGLKAQRMEWEGLDPAQIRVLRTHRHVSADTKHNKSALDGVGRCSVHAEMPPRGCTVVHHSHPLAPSGLTSSLISHPQLSPGSKTGAHWSCGVQSQGDSFCDPGWSHCSNLLTSMHPGDPSCWDPSGNIPPPEALAQVGFSIVTPPDCRVMWDALPLPTGSQLRGETVSPAPQGDAQ